MKKIVIIFTIAVLASAAVLGVFGTTAIQSAQHNEIKAVQNIAGAVTADYPDTEVGLVTAVMDKDYKTAAYGAEILSHYGYKDDMEIGGGYKKLLTEYFQILALLILIILGCGYAVFLYVAEKRKKQETELLALLDCCLSGDYGFIEDEQKMKALDNPFFADSLVKLAESMRLKTEYLNKEQDNTKTLVTDISHQLKTPISALKACFSMYLEADSENEKTEFQERTMAQMDKLEALAASLINISRLENGMITLQAADVTLDEIIVGAVESVYHKALKKNIGIETSDFENVKLKIDKKWTTEAVANVLDNAVKYSPCGSSVKISAQKLYSFVRIEIEDEGIGIKKQEKNNIFKRFYRGDNDFVKNEEGSGVGLYLARKILEEQGGTISARRSAVKGSVFIIQLSL